MGLQSPEAGDTPIRAFISNSFGSLLGLVVICAAILGAILQS